MFNDIRGLTIDITNKCTLKCKYCERATPRFKEMRNRYEDISFSDFKKLANYFTVVNFSGSVGDAVFHKDFDKMLAHCYKQGVGCRVTNAAPHKSNDWYATLFEANPETHWTFSLDGLPDTSYIHRVNQDSQRLFEIMLRAKHDFNMNVSWQYIVFSYNEDQINKAQKLAEKNGIKMIVLRSSRFKDPDDPLLPSKEYYVTNKDYKKSSVIYPKCFEHKSAGHSSLGYLMPCCWTSSGDIEKLYPELCNEQTKLSNVASVEDIINYPAMKKFKRKLESGDPTKVPEICLTKCGNLARHHTRT